MKNIKFLSLIVIIIACKGYEPLTVQRVNFSGKSLKTDGYYYIFDRDFGKGFKENYFDIFTLNQDGVYYNVVKGPYENNLVKEEKLQLLDKEFKHKIESEKDYLVTRPNWGVFNVQGNDLEIQRWVFSSGGCNKPIPNFKPSGLSF